MLDYLAAHEVVHLAHMNHGPRFWSVVERTALAARTALLVLAYTRGALDLLVVMYSINVFLTFTLSRLGMCVHWWQERARDPRRGGHDLHAECGLAPEKIQELRDKKVVL